MKICIVSGIFEPESGGPATYAPMLARKLTEAGNDVTVITYSKYAAYPADSAYPFKLVRVVRGNKILNRVRFFFTVRAHIRASDIAYMLDQYSAGLPASLAARTTGVPYIIRVGGDMLWEQRYIQSGKMPIALGEFYYAGFYAHYPILYRIIRLVLRGAQQVVFNSDIQRQLYERYYGLTRVSTIYNPLPERSVMEGDARTHRKEFVFWGRFITVKNLNSLIRAFALARPSGYSLAIIGEGPQKDQLINLIRELHLESAVRIEPGMPLNKLLNRVRGARASVLPSWSDISPNMVYESLAIGLPALVTKENYLSIRDQLPETIDPGSVNDIAAKLTMLTDDEKYAEFSRSFSSIDFKWTWDDVLRAHEALFNTIV